MDKTKLRQALLDRLQADLDLQTRAAHMAREEATSAESKAEHKYDMRGQEAAYLAEGQARLAAELQETLTLYRTLPFPDFPADASIDVGAVVELEARGKTNRYLLGPRNGGLEIPFDDGSITLVTPQSPLGRQLLGQRAGARVQLASRTGPVAHTIARVF